MIEWIILTIYILLIPCWIWFEKKYFPYKEGEEYTVEYDGAHEITPDGWKMRVIARAVLWPLIIMFIIAISPAILLEKVFDKL